MGLRRGISEKVFRGDHREGEVLWRRRSKYCVVVGTECPHILGRLRSVPREFELRV